MVKEHVISGVIVVAILSGIYGGAKLLKEEPTDEKAQISQLEKKVYSETTVISDTLSLAVNNIKSSEVVESVIEQSLDNGEEFIDENIENEDEDNNIDENVEEEKIIKTKPIDVKPIEFTQEQKLAIENAAKAMALAEANYSDQIKNFNKNTLRNAQFPSNFIVTYLKGVDKVNAYLTTFVNEQENVLLPFKKTFVVQFEGQEVNIKVIAKSKMNNEQEDNRRVVFSLELNSANFNGQTAIKLENADFLEQILKNKI